MLGKVLEPAVSLSDSGNNSWKNEDSSSSFRRPLFVSVQALLYLLRKVRSRVGGKSISQKSVSMPMEAYQFQTFLHFLCECVVAVSEVRTWLLLSRPISSQTDFACRSFVTSSDRNRLSALVS